MSKCLKQPYQVLNRSVSAIDVLFHHWPFHGSTSVVGFYDWFSYQFLCFLNLCVYADDILFGYGSRVTTFLKDLLARLNERSLGKYEPRH